MPFPLHLKYFGDGEKGAFPTRTVLPTIMINAVAMILTEHKRLSPAAFSTCSVKMGIKAALNAPSPKRRRNRLGILKATVKASHTIPCPKMLAHIMSLTRPSMRLSRVHMLIILAERNKLYESDMIIY